MSLIAYSEWCWIRDLRRRKFISGTRLHHSELLCGENCITVNKDKESFWHRQKGDGECPLASLIRPYILLPDPLPQHTSSTNKIRTNNIYRKVLSDPHSSRMLAKWCSKLSSKPGFNSPWTVNFQMFKVDLEKAEETEIKLPTSAGSQKKQENTRKTSTSALLTRPKSSTVWITTVDNSERDGNTRPPYLPPEKSVCTSRSNS